MRKRITAFVLAFLLLAGSLLICHIAGRSADLLPDAVEYRNEDDPSISFAAFEQMDFGKLQVSAHSVMGGTAEAQNAQAQVNIVVTDGNYPSVYHMDLIKGVFLSDDISLPQAVISGELAVEFFKSTDVIGQKLLINGRQTTIVGVYQPDKSFLSQISSDGTDAVFVPYGCGIPDLLQNAQYIGLSGDVSPEIETQLYAQSVDYREQRKILHQFPQVLFFMLGVIFLVCLTKFAARVILKSFSEFRQTVSRHEIPDKRLWFRPSLAAAVTAVFYIFILKLVCFSVYLPGGWIPEKTQFFDLGFYFQLIVDGFQARNTGANGYCDNLFFYSAWSLAGLVVITLILAVVLAFILMGYVKKNSKSKQGYPIQLD